MIEATGSNNQGHPASIHQATLNRANSTRPAQAANSGRGASKEFGLAGFMIQASTQKNGKITSQMMSVACQ